MDRNTNPDAAGSSGKDELRVHLDLNKLEGDAYGEFIKGIVNIYNPQEKRQRLCDTVGKHVPRETEIFKEMNDQIGLCFDGWNLPKLDDMDDNCGEDPRAQTPLEAEIPASEKFFQEEEAMLNPDDKAKIDDNADYWIILSGGCCKAAVQFVEEFLTPETKTGETNKDMLKRKEKEKKKRKREGKTEEELKKDLPEKIRLIKLLEKVIPQEDGSTGEIKKILTEELEEECGQLLETDKAAKLDRGIIDSYREVMMATDLYDFYEKLEKIRHVLENQMKALGIGASCRVQNEKIKEFELNRHALVRAFEHLTQYPFDEDDQKDFAKHITHLVVMICEATRFEPIAEHIKRSYTLELGSKLSDKNVALINMWSDISGVMVRGWSYKGERDFGLEDLMKAVTVSRAREWKGLGKEL
ncbi:hypothetical protein DCAR_0933407 [Daucus carota subsp. sativus]|uniref:rRNA N-glycosylase n=1 Tax=Daucus carota subsp. sativus TaxID=79200 RepID=A0A175YDB5_DAUCS|nr:hypothetical protein DCAR_0933407 [Daucus carota subsp. sativus]